MSKIIDKINARRQKRSSSSPTRNGDGDGDSPSPLPRGWYHSFEYFPPKTEPGLDNLLTRIDRMSRRLDPLFIDVTWGDAGSTAARTLAVASHAQRYCGVDVLMHLTCMGLSTGDIHRHLDQARSAGVRNVLALRGDPPRGKRAWEEGDVSTGDCPRALDLVKLIRATHGDYFGIAVAGHPEGHPASSSQEEELLHLKAKIDAGADLIVTQFFYDPEIFLAYVRKCRGAGIHCPILPGIMPIQSYVSFVRMTEFCGISVPSSVLARLEPVKDDDEAIKRIGWEIATDMCRRVLTASAEEGGVDGVHFYTLNLERSVTRVLIELGAVQCAEQQAQAQNGRSAASFREVDAKKKADGAKEAASSAASDTTADADQQLKLLSSSPSVLSPINPTALRPLPWRPSALSARCATEDVRPINWANRPKSYVRRTEEWDDFPNGRWGDATSPAFGELSDVGHFVGGPLTVGSDEDRRAMLGGDGLNTEGDVYEVFARYVEGHVPHIPWCETPLQPESFSIQARLAALNRSGFLTVNSQPPVNGARSTHAVFGWGGEGGRVYQKAYCECFVSRDDAARLVDMVGRHSSMHLYAVDNFQRELRVGGAVEEEGGGGVTALTWGVFPNREILQPTIFDPAAFLVWAEEAFSLWTSMWLNLYEPGSRAFDVIETIRDTYYLVAIIDNDYVGECQGGGEGGDGGGEEEDGKNNLWDALLEVGEVVDR